MGQSNVIDVELDGIFLDLYGTLTAGDRQAVEAVCESIIRETGLSISTHELSITWGERFFHSLDFRSGEGFVTLFDIEVETLRDTMALLGVEVDAVAYSRRLREYWRNPPLQDDASDFFASVRYPLCIVSNADRADAEVALKMHGLQVEALVTSEDARSYKPDRAIFEMALSRTGWRRERVIHVGDSLHSDVGGAIVAGLRSGWLNRAHRIHDIGTHEPDHEFDGLSALGAWLREFGR